MPAPASHLQTEPRSEGRPGAQPARARRAAWLRTLRSIVALYALWCGALFLMQSRMLYMPDLAGSGLTETEIASIDGLERLWIEQADGLRTEAWLLRASGRSGSDRPLVCLTHGNAELIDDCLEDVYHWRQRGFDVLLPEYRSYGRTPGTPSQAAIVGDVDRAITAALASTGASSLLFHGRSLGTGVAMQVASRHAQRTAAVVLESPFTSVAGFAWRYGVPPFIVSNPYRSDELLARFDRPVLLLHGVADEVIPFAHSESLAGLNPIARLVALPGTHNSGHSSRPAYWAAIDELLVRCGLRSGDDARGIPEGSE